MSACCRSRLEVSGSWLPFHGICGGFSARREGRVRPGRALPVRKDGLLRVLRAAFVQAGWGFLGLGGCHGAYSHELSRSTGLREFIDRSVPKALESKAEKKRVTCIYAEERSGCECLRGCILP